MFFAVHPIGGTTLIDPRGNIELDMELGPIFFDPKAPQPTVGCPTRPPTMYCWEGGSYVLAEPTMCQEKGR